MNDYSPEQYFQGTQDSSIDEKGRLPIPSLFRKTFAANQVDQPKEITVFVDIFDVLHKIDIDFVLLCTLARYKQIAKEVYGLHENATSLAQHRQVRDAKRDFFSHAAPERALDGNGRVLLQKQHREVLGESKVKLVGAGDRVEVWGISKWQKKYQERQDQGVNYYEGLGLQGLS